MPQPDPRDDAPPEPRHPLLRAMVTNAFVLSFLYLGIGLAVEVVLGLSAARTRSFRPIAHWLSLVLDALPARTLELVGLMSWLREETVTGELPLYGLRIVFAATTVGVIFALAFVVGGVMGTILHLRERQLRRPS